MGVVGKKGRRVVFILRTYCCNVYKQSKQESVFLETLISRKLWFYNEGAYCIEFFLKCKIKGGTYLRARREGREKRAWVGSIGERCNEHAFYFSL